MAESEIHVEKLTTSQFESDVEDSGNEGNEENRLSDPSADSEYEASDAEDTKGNSGMASIIARILNKDISKSNRVLLAKGKTDKEVLDDIKKRKRIREGSKDVDKSNTKILKQEGNRDISKDDKRKIWESMARKTPSILDNPKELRLRRTATLGMVQLFSSVNEHQKVIKQKLSSVGSSERKKDKVMSEFTKGKFLDLLKGKNSSEEKSSSSDCGGKWKILQDDFMMSAQMKDWDKDDDDEDGDDDNDESMEGVNVLSDDD